MQQSQAEVMEIIKKEIENSAKVPYILNYFLLSLTVGKINIPHKTEIMDEVNLEALENVGLGVTVEPENNPVNSGKHCV